MRDKRIDGAPYPDEHLPYDDANGIDAEWNEDTWKNTKVFTVGGVLGILIGSLATYLIMSPEC